MGFVFVPSLLASLSGGMLMQDVLSKLNFVEQVKSFNAFGTDTRLVPFEWRVDGRAETTMKAINEYWTSRQRQAHSLHEISYRACFKPQLPRFFIERFTQPGDAVYDPFMGRGTTQLEALLLGRKPLGNDINPLSQVLLTPRLNPPSLEQIEARLEQIDLSNSEEEYDGLLAFFHNDTLCEIIALKEYLLKREESGELDNVDAWIRMVAINRLTGHSPGFFSVYTLPPNQAVSIKSQERINEKREQTPEYKPIKPRILKKSKSLLSDWSGQHLSSFDTDLSSVLTTDDSRFASGIDDNSAQLVVTSPPFLDVVDYQADNWMRCWFIGIDSSTIEISQLKNIAEWEEMMTGVLADLRRIVKPGGHIAFEVGEVRGGKVLLEENVVRCGVMAGLEPIIILINDQEFTKTSNAWGVDNQSKGTNTNRIVVFRNNKGGGENKRDIVKEDNLSSNSDVLDLLRLGFHETIRIWNSEKLKDFEKLFGISFSKFFSRFKDAQKTSERTKIVSPILTNWFSTYLEDISGGSIEIREDDLRIRLGHQVEDVEVKLTTQPNPPPNNSYYWTGNHVSDGNKDNRSKGGWHLLLRTHHDDDGQIIAGYLGLLNYRECPSEWTSTPKKTTANWSTLKLYSHDKQYLTDIVGESYTPKRGKRLRFDYESIIED